MKTNDKENFGEKLNEKDPDKQNQTSGHDKEGDVADATKESEKVENMDEQRISTKALELDEDIRNDIEHTEVIPHVKKRHPLNTDRSDEEVEWKDETNKEPLNYEDENDEKGNFADGL